VGILKRLQTDGRPFAKLPEKKPTEWALTREEMKNCVWLKPQLVADRIYRMDTCRHLRHSKFCGLRDDEEPHEAVRE
jgi:hypothetical protein